MRDYRRKRMQFERDDEFHFGYVDFEEPGKTLA